MRIILQSFLLTLFCTFLDPTEGQNKKSKSYGVQKNSTNEPAQALTRHKYDNKREIISDEVDEGETIEWEKNCKGKNCKYGSSGNFRSEIGENNLNHNEINKQKYGKYSNEFAKVRKPSKPHRDQAGKAAFKYFQEVGSSEKSDNSGEVETGSDSKKRIVENVISVKDKLAHLKKKIGDIDPIGGDFKKRKEFKKRNENDGDYRIYPNSYKTKGIDKIQDADDSSEEQQSYKKIKRRMKSKLLESDENIERKKQGFKSILSENSKKRKQSKEYKTTEHNDSVELGSKEKRTESGEAVENGIKVDERIEEEDRKTCEKMEGEGGKGNDECNDNEGYKEESDFNNKKYKFSIKYAHEKKKVFRNKDDHFVKKLHGVDKKKHRLGDEDDDSDEDEALPKRLHQVIDEEE